MHTRIWIGSLLAIVAAAAVGCGGRLAHNAPPASRIMAPGPGVGGPGPGVIPVGQQMLAPASPAPYGPGGSDACNPMAYPGQCETGQCGPGGCDLGQGASPDSEIQQVQYCEGGYGGGGGGVVAGPPATSQIAFLGEDGLQVSWSISGGTAFDSAPLVVPGRQDFPQGAIYRLKLSNIPGRPSVMLYPTLEVAPVTPRTDAYLAHAPIPIQFTEEDFDQVLSGNFVTKVVYLPDPEFQELALAGVETLVSTRLDPGCDPIAEADKRGSILAILRIGNKNLEMNLGQPGYSGGVMPAGYQADSAAAPMPEDYSSTDAAGNPLRADSQLRPSDYEYYEGMSEPTMVGPMMEGEVVDGVPMRSGPPVNSLAGGPMPMGARTAAYGPTPVPPHMMAGAPQYGLPITGTPIGLPGPPHIPHGVPAGLQRHVMKNRTRTLIPPPTKQMTMSVKQRPGLSYPTPVNKVTIDETQRAPLKLFGGTLPGPFQLLKAKFQSKRNDAYCE